jgi:guanylate kinase
MAAKVRHSPRRGFLMMVVAPSGVGKTSLTRRLVADHQDLHLSVSYTTRDKRPGEQHERDYFFTDRPTFDAMVDGGAFLEWAEVYGQRYGSPRAPIMGLLEQGESVLFDIDLQGAASIRAQAPEDSVCVYLLPPSLAEMRRRLHARSQDTEETIHLRLERAKHEIVEWAEFDYVIVNENFDAAYAEIAHIYHAERSRRARNPWLGGFVKGLLDEGI